MILLAFRFIRDHGRIQTCNLLSRNQMRYSVAPRGLFPCESTSLSKLLKPGVDAPSEAFIYPSVGGVQIYFFLHLAQNQQPCLMDLKQFIRDVSDFPEPGIIFKDISPLLNNPIAFRAALEGLFQHVGGLQADKVVGIESRGFLFGPILASHLKAGFVPVRKPGKLPSDKLTQNYTLEYGSGSLEIHSDSILKGDRVVVHDDVLATGGTARATCDLVERLGGKVVQCNFLLDIQSLGGMDKLSSYPVRVLLRY